MRRRLSGLSERDWRVIDRVFAGAMLVLGVIETLTLNESAGMVAGSAATVSLMALALLWRRTRPIEVLLAMRSAVMVAIDPPLY